MSARLDFTSSFPAVLVLALLALAAPGSRAAIPGDVAPGTLDATTDPPTWRPAPDGWITVNDVVVLLRAAVGLQQVATQEPSTGSAWLPGDLAPGTLEGVAPRATWRVRGDGVIDVADVVAALRASVGMQDLAPLPARHAGELTRVAGCEELLAWLRGDAIACVEQGHGWYSPWWWGGPETDNDGDGGPSPAAGAPSGGAASSSVTNVQEAGVDELDIVKNDDRLILALSDDRLEIARAWPAESLASLASVKLEGDAQGLYLDGTRAVVLAQIWGTPGPLVGAAAMPAWAPSYGLTKVTVIDIADPSHPAVVRELYIDGWLQASRRIGHRVVLVMYHALAGPPVPEWTGDNGTWRAAAWRAIEASRVEDWLPSVQDHYLSGGDGWMGRSSLLVDCSDVHRPDQHGISGLVSVTAFDDDTHEPLAGSAVTGTVSSAYASRDAVYLTSDRWEPDQARTHVDVFATGRGVERPTYEGSADVPGTVASGLSMDEADGRLRMAVTTRAPVGVTSTSLLVLEPNGTGDRELVGALTGLAPGETLQSASFARDSAWLVTFRRRDPLFAIDLSDPRVPKLAGELEVSGFSIYLRALDTGHLMGIGPEADAAGAILGLQVSLFDVSRLDAPLLQDRAELSTGSMGTWQAWDPHAFSYFEPLSTLSVPLMRVGDWDSGAGWTRTFSGLAAFRVTTGGGIQALGELSGSAVTGTATWNPWCDQVRRSVFMEDRLYAVSAAGIVVAPLSHLATPIASLRFPLHPDCGGGGVDSGGGTVTPGSGGGSAPAP